MPSLPPDPSPRLAGASRLAPARLAALLAALLPALASCSAGSAGSAPPRAAISPTATTVTFPCATDRQGSPVVPPVVYVALAASDGNGVGADHPFTEGYVPLLIRRLPPGSRCLNPSISGATLDEALGSELPIALQAHPTLVTVWLAGNDFSTCMPLAQYGTELDTLLGTLQGQTRAHVFVANLPDMSLLPRFQNGAAEAGPCLQGAGATQIRTLVAQWNGVIAATATRHSDTLVDLFDSDLDAHPEYIASDGFHPSTAGYARLADLFWAQIQAHGGVPPS